MMTPKKKAEDLINKFYIEGDMLKESHSYRLAKKCALIAVDEILSDYKNYLMHENTEYKGLMYWLEVKKEIDNL